jgi:hypothetical protein
MSLTNSNGQTGYEIGQGFNPCTENQAWGDATNIITFPDRRASHPQPENTEPRSFGLLLRRALHTARDAVLRLSGAKNPVSVQRYSALPGTASAREPEFPPWTSQEHDGRPAHIRRSA